MTKKQVIILARAFNKVRPCKINMENETIIWQDEWDVIIRSVIPTNFINAFVEECPFKNTRSI